MDKLRKVSIETDMIEMHDIEENEMENTEETEEIQNAELVREDNERNLSSKPEETDMKKSICTEGSNFGTLGSVCHW